MPVILVTIWKIIASSLSAVWLPVALELLKRLNTERNVRRGAVLILRWLEQKATNPKVKEAIDIIADAWEVPQLCYKAEEKQGNQN